MSVFRAMEGAGARRWYLSEMEGGKVVVLGGPYPTRKETISVAARRARFLGERAPWPRIATDVAEPGFYPVHTDEHVYYVARASAMHDQGDDWGAAIRAYEKEVGVV